MICLEVQKLYGLASELEMMGEQSQDEDMKKKLVSLVDRLIVLADNIATEMDCADD